MSWIVSISAGAFGPYDTCEKAIFATLINFGFDGWIVTKTNG